MSALFSTDYNELSLLEPGIAVLTRSARAYPTIADLREDFAALRARLRELDTHGMGLIVDLRGAAGRNDEAFERAHAEERGGVIDAFQKVVMVVRTRVGELQVKRYLSQDGVQTAVFDDVPSAATWLRTEVRRGG